MAALLTASIKIWAQGPPITADKPIMLGGNSFTMKTLVEYRETERASILYAPLMLHYLPTSNSLVALHIPYLQYDVANGPQGSGLADVLAVGKYQFYRWDGTGKTYRMVAKTIQTLPTGEEVDIMQLSTGNYAGYFGIVSGYETLKYGISTELGYNWMPDGTLDEFRGKIGFGLPLLKPQYPNKQINLYFEYNNSLFPEREWYQFQYAQGIQYAGKNITFDLAFQMPLIQNMPDFRKQVYSLFIGTRYTF